MGRIGEAIMFSVKIPLSNCDEFAVIDRSDLELVQSFGKWYKNDSGYAVKRVRIGNKKKTIRMHSIINKTPAGLVTDHINGNRLDNRRKNLRAVSSAINSWNSDREYKRKYDLPKGVSYDKSVKKYVGSRVSRKRFNTLEEAIKFVEKENELYARNNR